MAFIFEKVVVHMKRQLLYSIVTISGLPRHSDKWTVSLRSLVKAYGNA